MRTAILQMRMSLDGYATGASGDLDWISLRDETVVEDQWKEWWKTWASVDTFVLGRKTYQVWEKRWPPIASNPEAGPNAVKFSHFIDGMRKVVWSRTLKSVGWKNSTLVSGEIGKELDRLKRQTGGKILIAGGPTLAQAAADAGLVDEFLLTVDPIVARTGTPLFSDASNRLHLKLIEAKTYASGSVLLHYLSRPHGSTT